MTNTCQVCKREANPGDKFCSYVCELAAISRATKVHHDRCIDHTTCDGMIAARDHAIHAGVKLLDAEKNRRIYYQDIVYKVCNILDQIYRQRVQDWTPVVCGTYETPTTQVQDLMRRLEGELGQSGECES